MRSVCRLADVTVAVRAFESVLSASSSDIVRILSAGSATCSSGSRMR